MRTCVRFGVREGFQVELILFVSLGFSELLWWPLMQGEIWACWRRSLCLFMILTKSVIYLIFPCKCSGENWTLEKKDICGMCLSSTWWTCWILVSFGLCQWRSSKGSLTATATFISWRFTCILSFCHLQVYVSLYVLVPFSMTRDTTNISLQSCFFFLFSLFHCSSCNHVVMLSDTVRLVCWDRMCFCTIPTNQCWCSEFVESFTDGSLETLQGRDSRLDMGDLTFFFLLLKFLLLRNVH